MPLRSEVCWKLTNKAFLSRLWSQSVVFVLNFEQISITALSEYISVQSQRESQHHFNNINLFSLNFREFICSLSVTTRGTFEEKLRWAFDVYDVDRNGVISQNEVLTIVKSINKMMGNINNKDSSEQRILTIFSAFDKNQDQMLSLDEFIEGAKKDATFVKMLQCSE